jgi:RES domain
MAPPEDVATRAAPWRDDWFAITATLTMEAWRGVESQTDIATLKLVDSGEEHEALESMLEQSKPPKPEGSDGLHYLIFTPFRYTSPQPSRFRRSGEGGVWYGADSVHAACAEIAYWRFRFILDSAGLVKHTELVTRHTVFKAQVQGQAIDLTSPPWVAGIDMWAHTHDYSSTQALAADARHRGIEWIRYASVRHPGASCAAALTVSALSTRKPQEFQEWTCRATRSKVLFYNRESGTTFSWDP